MVSNKEINWLYSCPECPKSFARPTGFQKHTLKEHSIRKTACRNCPLYFDDLRELFLHARQVHNITTRNSKPDCKLVCEFEGCTYKTNNGGLMKHHYRSHNGLKPYFCTVCMKKFTQKSNMKTHFNRHKKNNFNYHCIPCEKQFNSHDIYLSHMETREHNIAMYYAKYKYDFQCLVCEVIFKNPSDAVAHSDQCRLNELNQFECTFCHKSFPCDLEVLEEHFKSHTKEICCPNCKNLTLFADYTALNFHLTKVHDMKVARYKACRYCEQVFDSEQARTEHIKLLHADLKNKHRSCDETGRMKCIFNDCSFQTNSEILLQKHFKNIHNKDIDLDSFYRGLNKEESEFNHTEKARKRGRPRLCDDNENPDTSLPSLEDSMEPKKKRGRPSKSNNTSHDMSVISEIRKRGRPKKIKVEELTHESSDTKDFDNDAIEFKIDDCLPFESNYYYNNMGQIDLNFIKDELVETLDA